MSFLERQVNRREFIAGTLVLAGVAILGCGEEQEPKDSTLRIRNNRTTHLDVPKELNSIDGVKISDVYFYSNAQENITWLSLAFDKQVGAGFSKFSLYLAPANEEIDISHNELWLGQPKNEEVDPNSYLNAFSSLLGYLGDKANEVISSKSVILPVIRPQNENPYKLLYTKFDGENEIVNDVIDTKLTFEQPLPTRRT